MLDHIASGTGSEVLLVHGNSLDKEVWKPLLSSSHLVNYRLVAVDLPGHGGSPWNSRDEPYSLDGMAKQLANFTKGFRDPILVGHSLGGHLCLRLLQHVPSVRGAIVLGTPPMATAADLAIGFRPAPALAKAFTADLNENDARELALAYAGARQANVDVCTHMILATDPRVRADLGAEASSGRWSDELAMVRSSGKPVALLHGEHDPFVSKDYLDQVAGDSFMEGVVHVLPSVGHSPHLQDTETFARKLKVLIDRMIP